jgi:hypothetical protein
MRSGRVVDDLAKWFERLIANAKVATVLGSILASSDTQWNLVAGKLGSFERKILTKNHRKPEKNMNERLFRM